MRNDTQLEQVHWATNRGIEWPDIRIFAFDHRSQLEDMEGASADRIGHFKSLCLEAALTVAKKNPGDARGYGVLCDGRLGREALYRAVGTGLWIGRPVEKPGSRPLMLEPEIGDDIGGLAEWASGSGSESALLLSP